MWANKAEGSWAPWSEVRWACTPKWATKYQMRASQQVSILMVVRGPASSILLDLAMMVKRYQICCCDTVIGCTAAVGWLVNLALAQD